MNDLLSRTQMIHKLQSELRVMTRAAQTAQAREAEIAEKLKNVGEVNQLMMMVVLAKLAAPWTQPDENGNPAPAGTVGVTISNDEVEKIAGRYIVMVTPEKNERSFLYVPLTKEEIEAHAAVARAAAETGGAEPEEKSRIITQ